MKTKLFYSSILFASAMMLLLSCQKENLNSSGNENMQPENIGLAAKQADLANPAYDLNVTLRGACNTAVSEADDEEGETGDCPVGHLKFRQNPDAVKIIDLDIKIHNLLPNHEYALQRAVDPINVVDGNCTSNAWLTLGKGLTPQSITTNSDGTGKELLWRDVTAGPSGSKFDIHFRVIDLATNAVVLSSDCLQYQVR
jgi:hypothetical protein